ncbi:HNH endonuclease signature motif containing protein [Amycolatopsis methanolica]|uniref:HNH endonuclease signature motif containing protein n=1 Tax=Amycolatopsis methanolica TaxID=1814 RepID=UPI0009DAB168|nr:HNH endonuclease signature motif containing protein [Amycolatopsis methanolica]
MCSTTSSERSSGTIAPRRTPGWVPSPNGYGHASPVERPRSACWRRSSSAIATSAATAASRPSSPRSCVSCPPRTQRTSPATGTGRPARSTRPWPRSRPPDHIEPVTRGGDPLAPDNIVTACWVCNSAKGNLTLDVLAWTLRDPADDGWHGLADHYADLWAALGRPVLRPGERAWLAAERLYPRPS